MNSVTGLPAISAHLLKKQLEDVKANVELRGSSLGHTNVPSGAFLLERHKHKYKFCSLMDTGTLAPSGTAREHRKRCGKSLLGGLCASVLCLGAACYSLNYWNAAWDLLNPSHWPS